MVHVSYTGALPISVRAGFDYITDVRNWPSYWPGLIEVRDPESASWSKPGERVSLVMRLMRRPTELHLELKEFRAYELVAYLSKQSGLPDARHERRFAERDGRLEYTLVTEWEPRRGLRGLLDRLILRRAVGRVMRETVENLERRFSEPP